MGGSQSMSPAGYESKLRPQWFYLEFNFWKHLAKQRRPCKIALFKPINVILLLFFKCYNSPRNTGVNSGSRSGQTAKKRYAGKRSGLWDRNLKFSLLGHLSRGLYFRVKSSSPSYYMSHKRLFEQQIIEYRLGYKLIISRSTVNTRIIKTEEEAWNNHTWPVDVLIHAFVTTASFFNVA